MKGFITQLQMLKSDKTTQGEKKNMINKMNVCTKKETYNSARSSRTLLSTSMIFDPARSCMTSPEVTMGVIPSSMTVPRFEARITRIQ